MQLHSHVTNRAGFRFSIAKFPSWRLFRRQCAVALMALVLGLWGMAAMAIEEPAFEVIVKSGEFEIRQYRPFIVAEAMVDGEMNAASSAGFRLIADYIFGNNQSVRGVADKAAEKIAMTAPVTMEPVAAAEKIAMTAPVTMEPQGSGTGGTMKATRWRVHFVMPSQYSMATLPKPNNPAVMLRQVPGKRYAVLAFSGLAGEKKVQQKTDELFAWLNSKNLKPLAVPQLARYDPPWTLPSLRRNEILGEIAVP